MATEYFDLIASARVSLQTRAALLKRLEPDPAGYIPQAITPERLLTLRALTARIIPQPVKPGEPAIDLAARIDTILAEGKGDGWRYANLPSDTEACRIGLDLLNHFAEATAHTTFDQLTPAAQDTILDALASGILMSEQLDLQRWFEDMRAAATQVFVAHPQTLADFGYSGIADSEHGFILIGIGERESWEPEPQ